MLLVDRSIDVVEVHAGPGDGNDGAASRMPSFHDGTKLPGGVGLVGCVFRTVRREESSRPNSFVGRWMIPCQDQGGWTPVHRLERRLLRDLPSEWSASECRRNA